MKNGLYYLVHSLSELNKFSRGRWSQLSYQGIVCQTFYELLFSVVILRLWLRKNFQISIRFRWTFYFFQKGLFPYWEKIHFKMKNPFYLESDEVLFYTERGLSDPVLELGQDRNPLVLETLSWLPYWPTSCCFVTP